MINFKKVMRFIDRILMWCIFGVSCDMRVMIDEIDEGV